MPNTPSFREELISQIPALQMLMGLGYEYLTPDDALANTPLSDPEKRALFAHREDSYLIWRYFDDLEKAGTNVAGRNHPCASVDPTTGSSITAATQRIVFICRHCAGEEVFGRFGVIEGDF